MDWESFGNLLPQKTIEELTVPPAKSIGVGLKSIFDICLFPVNRFGIYVNGELEKYEKKI